MTDAPTSRVTFAPDDFLLGRAPGPTGRTGPDPFADTLDDLLDDLPHRGIAMQATEDAFILALACGSRSIEDASPEACPMIVLSPDAVLAFGVATVTAAKAIMGHGLPDLSADPFLSAWLEDATDGEIPAPRPAAPVRPSTDPAGDLDRILSLRPLLDDMIAKPETYHGFPGAIGMIAFDLEDCHAFARHLDALALASAQAATDAAGIDADDGIRAPCAFCGAAYLTDHSLRCPVR